MESSPLSAWAPRQYGVVAGLRLSDSVMGFEAAVPAHGRSAVGGDTRLFRISTRDPELPPDPGALPASLGGARGETGQAISSSAAGSTWPTGRTSRCCSNRPKATGAAHEILSREEMAGRYPQHNLRPDDVAIYDPTAVRCAPTGRSRHVAAAEANGATVHTNTPIDTITETADGVVITSGERSWTFESVIISSGGWSRKPDARIPEGRTPDRSKSS